MPEGDTIARAARTLDKALRGRTVSALRADGVPGPAPPAGGSVEGVSSQGKHLLIAFSGGVTLHTHMGMNGSWHLYRPGERWRVPAHRARIVIATEEIEAVCFSPMKASFVRPGTEQVSHLGPDLSVDEPDLAEAVRRLAAIPGAEVGVALLDQRVAAGLGNVYRSEVLFLAGVDPFARVGDLPPEALEKLMEIGSRLLRANLTTQRRTTVAEGLAVYGRTNRPCIRCGTPVRSARQGSQARTVYWCPVCQPGSASG
ncbi:MAG TPA: DNA-formamidopyrimidine glycosylase family protein [Actinomycetota bacterium]|nr:DNA-formamidopyrimidine glycosylase family protein [Actinomycetota bacterium]